jgi:hypothetical protein
MAALVASISILRKQPWRHAAEQGEVPLAIMRLVTSRNGRSEPADFGLAASARALDATLAIPEDAQAPAFFSTFMTGLPGDLQPKAALWRGLREAIAAGAFDPKSQPLLLDCSWEGWDFDPWYFEAIHARLEECGVALDGVAYLQMSFGASQAYETWADEKGLPRRMRLYTHWGTNATIGAYLRQVFGPDWRFEAFVRRTRDAHAARRLPPKRFLCLNNIPKPMRLAVATTLVEAAGDAASVSFGRITPELQAELARQSQVWFDEPENLDARIADFASGTPRILDVETGHPDARAQTSYGFDPALYIHSAMSIVTESEASSKDCMRLTEKTFKPLGMMHPVLLAGNRGSLGLLRDMGLLTFAPFIDESYDNLRSGHERVHAVLREIRRLAALSNTDFAEGVARLSDTLAHNANFMRTFYAKRQAIELETLMRQMRRDFALRFGFAPEAALYRQLPALASDVAPLAVEPGVACVFRDGAGLRLVADRGFDAGLWIFAHIHPPEGADRAVQAFTFSWPFGQDAMWLDLPLQAGDSVSLGQFSEFIGVNGVTYLNAWTVTAKID